MCARCCTGAVSNNGISLDDSHVAVGRTGVVGVKRG